LLSNRWLFNKLFVYVHQVMFPVVFTWHNSSSPLPSPALAPSQRGSTTSQRRSRTWFLPVSVVGVLLRRGETCLLCCCPSAREQGSGAILSCGPLWARSRLEVVSTPLEDFAKVNRFSRQLSPDELRASATHQRCQSIPTSLESRVKRSPPRRKSKMRYSFPSVWNAETQAGAGIRALRGGKAPRCYIKHLNPNGSSRADALHGY